MNRTMTEISVSDHKEQEDSGLIAAIIIFSGSLLITLAALVSIFEEKNKNKNRDIFTNNTFPKNGIFFWSGN